jgi:vitamin B12 transporter
MSRAFCALVIATSASLSLPLSIPAFAQSAPEPAPNAPAAERPGLQITLTANRSPTEIQRVGSAITVISAEDIRKTNPASLADVLRGVPGLVITENGGPGSTSVALLRGANAHHTMVLIDGMRVNDPSDPSGTFDFTNLAPGLIERIEVLRGPQSALYGSGAIGGVINIITKRGRGPFTTFAQAEGGAYGTISGNAGFYGTKDAWSYALSVSSLKTDGFSRYGYRVGRAPGITGKLEADGAIRHGAYGRVGYNPGTGFRFEIGSMATSTRADYDSGFYDPVYSLKPDTPNRSSNLFHSSFAKAELDTFDNRLKHILSVFASQTKRDYRSYYTVDLPPPTDFLDRYQYIGTRTGAEYQANLALDTFGSLIMGGRIERESIESFSEAVFPFPVAKTKDIDKRLVTRSAFALWQASLGSRIDVSLGGRLDSIANGAAFRTWRATAAYRIDETGTKFRSSIGTGGKAPTLYQLYAPFYGVSSLQAERSFGIDAGVDQRFFDGRLTLSLTGFTNRINQMIDFEFNGANCPGGLAAHASGCFNNIARAKTSGIESAIRVVVWQDYATLNASYTFLKAKDRQTGLALARRPEHAGKLGLTLTPFTDWTIEPTLTLIAKRFSSSGEAEHLAPYARLDALVSYRVNDHLDVYLRGENLTNARYQEVTNFGTTGRALYAGVKGSW